MRKKKKLEAVKNFNWTKKERLEYQNWLSEKFKTDEINKQSEWKIIGSNTVSGVENDFDDSVLMSLEKLSIPIFYLNKVTQTFEVDLIPGTHEVALSLTETQQIMR